VLGDLPQQEAIQVGDDSFTVRSDSLILTVSAEEAGMVTEI